MVVVLLTKVMKLKYANNLFSLGPKMFLNLLKRLALGLVAEGGDVSDSAEADGGEEPEHAGLRDGVLQRRERQGDYEGQGPVKECRYPAGSPLHFWSEHLACAENNR